MRIRCQECDFDYRPDLKLLPSDDPLAEFPDETVTLAEVAVSKYGQTPKARQSSMSYKPPEQLSKGFGTLTHVAQAVGEHGQPSNSSPSKTMPPPPQRRPLDTLRPPRPQQILLRQVGKYGQPSNTPISTTMASPVHRRSLDNLRPRPYQPISPSPLSWRQPDGESMPMRRAGMYDPGRKSPGTMQSGAGTSEETSSSKERDDSVEYKTPQSTQEPTPWPTPHSENCVQSQQSTPWSTPNSEVYAPGEPLWYRENKN
ncbi:hypothetical protein B0T11DRAFT_286980 [Plectosphaerella cucumerina]|uniref:Uncharacterized protein n=1 Tax=Plectosphaerella cucumerina TaxID=40658 RepID=A0A8K0T9Q7_9PEZI|nr:hypothetical protein B0T11DRAFT_286980 [Plectosphaerella cucumerina]